MDELVSRIVSATGIDAGVAEKAIGIIINFIAKEGPAEPVQQLLAAFPGAADIVAAGGEGGGGGGLMGALGGMMGMGGIMAVGQQLMGAGLSMGQVQTVSKEVMGYAREKAGEDTVGQIVAAIPGLSQFV
jgi:hypothetical protein